jgi:hypothetical protein
MLVTGFKLVKPGRSSCAQHKEFPPGILFKWDTLAEGGREREGERVIVLKAPCSVS